MSNENDWNKLREAIDALVKREARGDGRRERYFRRKLENWAINRGSGHVDAIKKRLKAKLYVQQGGQCAECDQPLDAAYFELDRLDATFEDDEDRGYREGNVRAVHPPCNPRGPHPAGRASGTSSKVESDS